MAAVVPVIADAVDVAVALIQAAEQIMSMVQTAQAAGQTVLTADQWATITGNEDSAEAAVAQAIAKAKAKGQ